MSSKVMRWMESKDFYCYFVLALIFLNPARGDYILRVQVHSYDNPTNLCAGCGEGPGCCDNFGGNDCTGEERCDNIFFYCLRPLGTPTRTLEAILENRLIFENSIEDHARELQCLQPPPAFRSDRNVDDGFINFSETEFLGLPNPMEFQVNASMWEGAQLYVDVSDDDDNSNSQDDFIESFAIDINPIGLLAGEVTEAMIFTGLFGFANTTLSFEVDCLPGFVGEFCVPDCSTDPCSNNGTCRQNVSGIACECRGDFTGETCETMIDDCQDVDCNDGTCVDGVRSFACLCEPGFTGDFCGERATTAITTITTATSGDDSIADINTNVVTMAVAVAGGVIAILLIIIVTLILLVLCRQRKGSSSKENQTNGANGHSVTLDNPVHDTQEESDERELENPIYGLEDSVEYDVPYFVYRR